MTFQNELNGANMKVEIKNRFSGELIFSIETDSWKLAIEAAIKAKSDLHSADLRYADLHSANLSYADLHSANLSYADLSYADLHSANLSSADLRSADLHSADLSYADLSYADLHSANLSYGQLVQFRDDIWAVLCAQPLEVSGLRQALVDGKINGSSYEGECACLVGTIAKVAKKKYDCLPVLKPNQRRPAEIFFMLINIGDVPEKSKWAKMAIGWIDQWTENMKMAFNESHQ
jgi:hypothetical protein